MFLRGKALTLCILTIVIGFNSCKRKEEEPKPVPKSNSELANSQFIYDLMKSVYLWDDKLPVPFDVNAHADAKSTLNALLYKSLDRWSYLMDANEFDKLMKEGQYLSYGYFLDQDRTDGSIYVCYVYKGSPMAQAGVERGYLLQSLNGVDINTLIGNGSIYKQLDNPTNSFGFVDLDGNFKTLSISKGLVNINTVLHKEVINLADKKVGYLVFNSFLQTSEAELNEAFSFFSSNGVTELVLDLRYNGGGSIAVAAHLAGLLAPEHGGKVFNKSTHNSQLASWDSTYLIKQVAGGLPLQKLVVITSKYTASASELIINGLRPYMDVKTLGGRTNGKPTGMYRFYSPDKKYAILPICFSGANANGLGGYYNGLGVDSEKKDDISVSFGSENEDCLAEALYYLRYNSFTGRNARMDFTLSAPLIELKGLAAEAGCL